jgi:hypothetical protein
MFSLVDRSIRPDRYAVLVGTALDITRSNAPLIVHRQNRIKAVCDELNRWPVRDAARRRRFRY